MNKNVLFTIDYNELKNYYETHTCEFAFSRKCLMTFRAELTGMKVLDLNCRRGKGVVKLASYAGNDGYVVGIDPSACLIKDAKAYVEKSRIEEKFGKCKVSLMQAYPEDLKLCGMTDASFDVVFANSSINVAYSPTRVLYEINRVLKPGGLLVLDSVVSEGEQDKITIQGAREIGNVIQAAISRTTLETLLDKIGFETPEYFKEYEIDPDAGFTDECKVAVVPTNKKVCFTKTTIQTRKRMN